MFVFLYVRADDPRFVLRKPVPEERDSTLDVSRKMFESGKRIFFFHRSTSKGAERSDTLHRSISGNDACGGDVFPRTRRPNDRSSALLPPRTPHDWTFRVSRFIEKTERRFQVRPLFWSLGHSTCFQLRMAFSSRSFARRIGFWHEKPSACMTCQTERGR